MDISFKTEEGIFNYRVCAVIVHEGKILAMHDERSPYYYLPGGRVELHETAENAVLREVREELEIEAEILRPLWLNQGFFVEDVNHRKYHEICLYFLVDISDVYKRQVSDIIRSITRRLFVLPEDTMVYPGHGEQTTIGHEKQYNPVVPYLNR